METLTYFKGFIKDTFKSKNEQGYIGWHASQVWSFVWNVFDKTDM